ncbi:hypothetical protein ODJ79_12585 [Actinoplanes sp. KI2]|uniref:hypothetical protein n=1 Tax=Actinoplanes sp. KI2 TaxID=2983315 RepID=UPI0021D5E0EA|nr:hypothetical protein [Actinoplanes sp. KI2]MCU7724556.1 hypothetical protein [Actinoplanes sp. KI2]
MTAVASPPPRPEPADPDALVARARRRLAGRSLAIAVTGIPAPTTGSRRRPDELATGRPEILHFYIF